MAGRDFGERLALLFREFGGQDDLYFREQVAVLAVLGPHAVALDAEPLAAGGAGRDRERDRAPGRGDVDLRTLGGLGERDGDADVEAIAGAAEERMGAGADRDQDVAGRCAAFARLALAADADPFAVVDAGGNLDRDRFQIAVGRAGRRRPLRRR